MGTTTDGQICYGILFDESHHFPWYGDVDDYDGYSYCDIDEWWREVNGYQRPFELYDKESGGYVGGVRPSDDKIDEYYDHMREWENDNPLPIQLVNYCYVDVPIYIIAVPRTVLTAGRGYPEKFNPSALTVTEEEHNSLIEFCEKYGIDTEGEKPAWYLSSYWG